MRIRQTISRLIGALLTFYLSTSALWAATNVTVGGLKYQIDTSAGTAIVMGISSTSGSDLTIPGSIVYNNSTYQVTTINARAFRSVALTGTLKIGDGVTTIRDEAFQGCKFDAIILPATLSTIGADAFDMYYSNLRYVRCYRTTPPKPIKTGYEFFQNSLRLNTPLQVPKSALSNYQSVWEWSGFKTITEIPADPTKISLNRSEAMIEVGESLKLTATILPSSASSSSVTWATSSSAIATVSNGTIKGVKAGTATITAKTENGITAKCTVTVVAASPFTFTYTTSSKTATVTGLKSSITALSNPVIPDVTPYNGDSYIVTAIKDAAFSSVTRKLSGTLTIGKNIITIGKNAFNSCNFKGNLTIPNSVISIGDNAFAHTTFDGNLLLGSSLQTIGIGVFYGIHYIEGNVNIPNSVKTIGDEAFYDLNNLTSSSKGGLLTIGNGVTTIGNKAFYRCSGFQESLIIPESVITIGENAFFQCTGFSGSLTIGNSVTTIGEYAFSGCRGFTGSLTLGNSLTEVGFNAFCDCQGFTGALVIPESLTTISNYAFSYCNKITELYLPSTLKQIGIGSFNCSAIRKIECLALTPPICVHSDDRDCSFESYVHKYATLYIPYESVAKYENAFCWKDFSNVVAVGYKAPESISLSDATVSINVGGAVYLYATVNPSDAPQEVSWTSSDNSIASVNNGEVVGHKWGTTTITATTVNGLSASCVVSVWMKGDVNNDGVINVADVTITSNYIAGLEPDNFTVEAADINGDGEITVTDAVLIAKLILNAESVLPQSVRKISSRGYYNGIMNMTINGRELSFSLPYAGYTAFQADLRLPDSVAHSDLKLTSEYANTHVIMTADKGDNIVRLIVFSLNNSEFNDGDEIVHITLPDDSGFTIDGYNIVASDTNGYTSNLLLTGDGVMSGVESVSKTDKISIKTTKDGISVSGASQQKIFCYTVDGRLVKSVIADSNKASISLTPGLYVVKVGNFSDKIIIK